MAVSSLGVLVLTACASVEERGNAEYEAQDLQCPRPNGPVMLRVPVIATDSHLMVPPRIHVCAGDSVILNWMEHHQAGSVMTTPVNANDNTWLHVSNDSETELPAITPPVGTPTGDHKFMFEVQGVGRLDPRFVVQ